MRKIIFAALTASMALAAGYKMPEQSIDSIGLAASNIAKSFSPDVAYYNPANMLSLEDGLIIESMTSFIRFDSVEFKGESQNSYYSKQFKGVAGAFHMLFPKQDRLRFGLSMAVPVGLEMRWANVPSNVSRNFKLNVIELNPSLAYAINDKISIGGGLSLFYIKGKADGEFYSFKQLGFVPYRELKGDGWSYGYNLALAYKPTEDLSFGLTYRSKVKMDLKGDAKVAGFRDLSQMPLPPAIAQDWASNLNYSGNAKVKGLVIPATINLGVAYDITKDTTILAALERTFWSEFKGYDFDFSQKQARHAAMFNKAFDEPSIRNFKDSNVYRFGLNHKLNEKLRFMLGFAYDEGAAADDKSSTFEVPDTKAYVYSFALAYSPIKNLELGLGYLYQHRKERSADVEIINGATSHENGTFKKADIQIFGTSLKYKF